MPSPCTATVNVKAFGPEPGGRHWTIVFRVDVDDCPDSGGDFEFTMTIVGDGDPQELRKREAWTARGVTSFPVRYTIQLGEDEAIDDVEVHDDTIRCVCISGRGATLQESVGRGGQNREADVRRVQELLHTVEGAFLEPTGMLDSRTLEAIRSFLARHFRLPGEILVPDSEEVEHLLAMEALGLVLLPQSSGNGYYSYEPATNQYGSSATIQAVLDVGRQWRQNQPDLAFGVGDISLQGGGKMPGHNTHQHGTDVDLRPLRKDGRSLPVAIHDSAYSRPQTELLVRAFLAHANVKNVLFNDTSIPGVIQWPGHDNHLHVNMKT